VICPQCGSHDIRRSHTNKWLDVVRKVRDDYPYRCRECHDRFYSKTGADSRKTDAKQGTHHRPDHARGQSRGRRNRHLIESAIFLIVLAIFWLFLRFLTTEPATPDSIGLNSGTESKLALSCHADTLPTLSCPKCARPRASTIA
jgi:hypothetical protein